MGVRRRMRRYGAPPPGAASRHRWIAIALVVVVLLAMAVWIGIELSDWPPKPPHEVSVTR